MNHLRLSLHYRLLVSLFLLVVIATTAVAQEDSLRETAAVRAVRLARPSVVNIHGKKTLRSDHEAFGQSASHRQVNGMGTGIILDERGYVITNFHVVDGVRRIQVTLADKRTISARLVAHDPTTDLAVIKLTTNEPMPVIKIGTSSDLMLAERVLAIGNAYGYEHTVSQGIISGLNRTVQVSDDQTYIDLIQTDASINPGNSGGPLLNIDGEMIAINVAVRVGAQGIGFAIPVDRAMEVAARLMRIPQRMPVSHGVTGETKIDETSSQYVVTAVRSGSPADKAGIQPGDVIAEVGKVKVNRSLDFERSLVGRTAGEEIGLVVDRDGESHELTIELSQAKVVSNTSQVSDNSRSWSKLGMRFQPVPDDEFRALKTKYRGGLRVIEVKEGSPAQLRGIQTRDILVGMHIWETVTIDNIAYILNRSDLREIQPMKFYVVRDGSTLYGEIEISAD